MKIYPEFGEDNWNEAIAEMRDAFESGLVIEYKIITPDGKVHS